MSVKSKIVRYFFDKGGDNAAKALTRNYPRVLMYHRFSHSDSDSGKLSRSNFTDQVNYLLENFELVSIDEVVNDGNRHSIKPRVCITVDDGYEDFYDIAYPILKKYGIPATFYVTTDFVDEKIWFWYDRIRWCLEQSDLDDVRNAVSKVFHTNCEQFSSKDAVWAYAVSNILELDPCSVEEKINSLSNALSLDIPKRAPKKYKAATWNQIKEMSLNGITVGAHTLSHYSLGPMEREEVISQIRGSKDRIEEMLETKVRHFCFPNGQPSDIPLDYCSIFGELGFHSSVVAFYDRKGVRDPFAIRRHGVGSDFYAFKKSVCGVDRIGAILLNKDSKFSWSDL
ncbi:polysaccharide deacetylase family protein [Marinobacter daepoensis]|uniref:polysaccharide deacetylase family protein n=1 Tax=Marinobacter daepoensis TaxID=262077 RepID=UPI001C970D61|nr:polysaccharide deacetylase family protein [Marinobacter daepoensis]MBY6032521.1 polysaccharide deacetylase family protein [Marinobacter daepoensis]